MPHTYIFNVTMTCGGCSGAVTRVLNKLDGVTNVETSLETQIVSVTTLDSVDYQSVYNAIEKTGKKINSGETVS